jgi:hypothetical protein
MNQEDTQIRAARAEQLLDDEVLKEALETIAADALFKAGTANLADPKECVAAIAAIQAITSLEYELKKFVTDGKAAQRKPHIVA